MRIGVPKEIKVREYRVGLTPNSVAELVGHGHDVVVETTAGLGIGCSDQDYIDAGASILPDAAAVFEAAEMIVKVKEPQAVERAESARVGELRGVAEREHAADVEPGAREERRRGQARRQRGKTRRRPSAP